ncbi:ATP-binding cassette domain-containing protein [Pseudonocardia sp. TRM90224]|uniref:ATP-binding cassette domain-containing protein n=1 Tax=Pseudonocardia sp. TRM90224 TaxID=2812678 RepID=UPI001E2D8A8B|nr:ATP-binding cassette domain-containing protein [Pseudonocardia sp. TRM90224]
MPVVETSNLQKSFGDHRVLDGVDISVAEGTVFALLGPNGAGKTTVVNILSTLVRADGGSASVAGHDVAREPVAVRAAISVTGQFSAVDALLTGRENLTMMARLSRVPRHEIGAVVEKALARFDLVDAADRRSGSYSGGMARRLDIAISMLAMPRVLFLDEPTTGLDPRSRQGVWEFVRELVGEGVTVFLTTQYLEEADRLADRIALLDGGRIVADDAPAALKRLVGSDIVEATFADGRVACYPTDGSLDDIKRTILGLEDATHVTVRNPSLDDVFLTLTGKSPKQVTGKVAA